MGAMLLGERAWESTMYRWCRQVMILALLVTLITACAGPATAPQAAPRMYRVGYFGSGGDPRPSSNNQAFVEELTRLGYTPGQNLTIEYRWAEGKGERLREIAQELIGLKLDAIFTSSEQSAQAMLEAEGDVPIVMAT
jgi:putative ABC transport system substrate-binding protein